jgi:hypothetical protein
MFRLETGSVFNCFDITLRKHNKKLVLKIVYFPLNFLLIQIRPPPFTQQPTPRLSYPPTLADEHLCAG